MSSHFEAAYPDEIPTTITVQTIAGFQCTRHKHRLGLGETDYAIAMALWVKPKRGYIDLICHGTADAVGLWRNGTMDYFDHWMLALMIQSQPGFRNRPIRLLSCKTGQWDDGIAQKLADLIRVPVLAPTGSIRAEGEQIVFVDDGAWRLFTPR